MSTSWDRHEAGQKSNRLYVWRISFHIIIAVKMFSTASFKIQKKNPQRREARQGFFMVHPTGFEPVAFWFVVKRSIQLSYGCNFQFSVPFCSEQKVLYCTARRMSILFWKLFFIFSLRLETGEFGAKTRRLLGKNGSPKMRKKNHVFSL